MAVTDTLGMASLHAEMAYSHDWGGHQPDASVKL